MSEDKYLALPPDLEAKVNNLSALQRKYCEYRSRGIVQAECMKLAGSTSQDYKVRADMGYQIERMDGAKEYIEYLKAMRAKVLEVEEEEVIQKLRDIYQASMSAEKFQYAVQSVQLMGESIGMFGKSKVTKSKEEGVELDKDPEAFKSEGVQDQLGKLRNMLKDINKGPKDEVAY